MAKKKTTARSRSKPAAPTKPVTAADGTPTNQAQKKITRMPRRSFK